MSTIILLAKECIPGKVKTRLHPPLSLEQAAEVAAECLAITARALDGRDWTRKILCFDGTIVPPGFEDWEVIPQSLGGLDERIGAILDRCQGPTVLIGMDSPQLDPEVLDELSAEWPSDLDAWFGPAEDGGFWLLALKEPDGNLVRGVPMSRDDTGAIQRDRLRSAGLRVHEAPALRDIDSIADLRAAAEKLPGTGLARYARTAQDALKTQDAQSTVGVAQ